MNAAESDELIVERVGAVAVLKINRPERRNATHPGLRLRLHDAAAAADADPDVRVGILASSTPGLFSAGGDLGSMSRQGIVAPTGPQPSFSRLARTKPWIAAVSGPALGGGLEMALSCDLRVASAAATFGLPEVKRGILAAAGGVFRLTRALPSALAAEMILTGQAISAERALHYGLVSQVTEGLDALPAALQLAEAIVACAPLSIAESLALMKIAQETAEEGLWRLSDAAIQRLASSADAAEGISAFVEKRPPRWTGA